MPANMIRAAFIHFTVENLATRHIVIKFEVNVQSNGNGTKKTPLSVLGFLMGVKGRGSEVRIITSLFITISIKQLIRNA